MPIEFNPAQRAELQALPKLAEMPDEQIIVCSHRQLSLLSTLPAGTVGAALARELKPAIPGSKTYRVRDLREFCTRHAEATAVRVSLSLAARPGHEFADPAEAARAYQLGLLNQAKS